MMFKTYQSVDGRISFRKRTHDHFPESHLVFNITVVPNGVLRDVSSSTVNERLALRSSSPVHERKTREEGLRDGDSAFTGRNPDPSMLLGWQWQAIFSWCCHVPGMWDIHSAAAACERANASRGRGVLKYYTKPFTLLQCHVPNCFHLFKSIIFKKHCSF